VEWTCVRALAPHPLAGEHPVGTRVDLGHGAATPAGMRATAAIELVERDEIGAGFRERFAIDEARFLGRPAEKRSQRS